MLFSSHKCRIKTLFKLKKLNITVTVSSPFHAAFPFHLLNTGMLSSNLDFDRIDKRFSEQNSFSSRPVRAFFLFFENFIFYFSGNDAKI